nr:LacI family DNA-binding transcriptional regulator [Proteiniphilum sp.]
MQRKARIKDIAEMAGVSSGTVDRILHNRGNVSESARKAVEEVLKKVNYKPNIHISGLSLKRKYKVVITRVCLLIPNQAHNFICGLT